MDLFPLHYWQFLALEWAYCATKSLHRKSLSFWCTLLWCSNTRQPLLSDSSAPLSQLTHSCTCAHLSPTHPTHIFICNALSRQNIPSSCLGTNACSCSWAPRFRLSRLLNLVLSNFIFIAVASPSSSPDYNSNAKKQFEQVLYACHPISQRHVRNEPRSDQHYTLSLW